MRLIIEITYHSSALAVSSERFPPVDGWRGGRGKQGGVKNNRRRRYLLMCDRVYVYARSYWCAKTNRVLFVCIRRAVDLNKSFSRDNPRRVCHFISCNFVLDAPQNTTYIPFYTRMYTYACVCVVVRISILARECFSLLGPTILATVMQLHVLKLMLLARRFTKIAKKYMYISFYFRLLLFC